MNLRAYDILFHGKICMRRLRLHHLTRIRGSLHLSVNYCQGCFLGDKSTMVEEIAFDDKTCTTSIDIEKIRVIHDMFLDAS